jgi:hypothetical protein
VLLWSRNENDFALDIPPLRRLWRIFPRRPSSTARSSRFDDAGKPSFNALQNYGSSKATVVFYVFDVPIVSGLDPILSAVIRQLVQARSPVG